jgi:hypothetical protein
MVSVNSNTTIAAAAPAAPASKKMLWAGRVVSALPVLLMLVGGVMSLLSPAAVAEGTAKLGYPAHLTQAIVLLEIACAALYVLPRTAVLGAILLTAYLGGATASHVRVGDPFVVPVIVGILVWGGLWLREPRVRALIPLREA